MNRTRVLSVVVVLGALLSIAEPARAEIIAYGGVGKHVNNLSITVYGAAETVTAGELNWSWLAGTPDGYSTNFYSYCVDALESLEVFDLVSVRSSSAIAGSTNAGAKVSWLFNTFAAGIHASGGGVQAAALQVAIWEALYDSTANLTGGSFQLNTSGSVRNQATDYLNALYSSNYVGAYTTFLDARFGQDQITYGVPEPASLLMVGCALLGFARWRKRAQ